jgi:hypothetical protein
VVAHKEAESTPSRAGLYLVASVCCSGVVVAQTARVAFEESRAVYGPEIFPALTHVHLCGDFRVLVAYVNGTDLLFIDEVEPADAGSTYRVVRSFGLIEFNHYEASRSITDVACQKRDADLWKSAAVGTMVMTTKTSTLMCC